MDDDVMTLREVAALFDRSHESLRSAAAQYGEVWLHQRMTAPVTKQGRRWVVAAQPARDAHTAWQRSVGARRQASDDYR